MVLDASGEIAAATSTGGKAMSVPDRVSDSATVAGTFASAFAGVSCTGIGEEIVDDGLAVRLETRVRDGMGVVEASEAALRGALAAEREYGWIGLDRSGAWAMYSTVGMACAVRSADRDEAYQP